VSTHCRGEGFAFVTVVCEQVPLEAQFSEAGQHWQGAGPVVVVGRRHFEIDQRAMLVAHDMKFDALDVLAAIDAAGEAGWRRTLLSTTRAEGSASSPQAIRQSRASR
jgi:hypothetical protein